jgi:PAS domain-containing protein
VISSAIVWWAVSSASALLLAALAVFLWLRRPPVPIWPAVFRCQLYALLWVLGDIWATHAQTPLGKQIALVVLFSGSLALPAAWFLTVRHYVAAHGLERRWMRSRLAYLPTVWAGLSWLFMLTDPWHGQFATAVVQGANQYHWGANLAFYVNHAIALATMALALWAARRHRDPDVRLKMGILAAATLAPGAANAFHLLTSYGPRLDPAALGLGLGSAAILYGIYRRRLFNPLPVALPELIRRDPNGLMVLDRGGRLIMWNPAAERLLEGFALEPDLRVLRALAWRLSEPGSGSRLRSSRELTALLTDEPPGSRHHVFEYRGGGESRWLRLALVPIPSRRGRLAAVCVRIEDVTAQ